MDFRLSDCLLGSVKLSNNADPNKYGCSVYGIGFAAFSQFSLSNSEWGKIVVIFGVDHSTSVHANNRKKDILVLGEGPPDGLDGATLTIEAKYSISNAKSKRENLLKTALQWK